MTHSTCFKLTSLSNRETYICGEMLHLSQQTNPADLLCTSSISASFTCLISSTSCLARSSSMRCLARSSEISFLIRRFSSSVATMRSANSCRIMSDTWPRSSRIFSSNCKGKQRTWMHFKTEHTSLCITQRHNTGWIHIKLVMSKQYTFKIQSVFPKHAHTHTHTFTHTLSYTQTLSYTHRHIHTHTHTHTLSQAEKERTRLNAAHWCGSVLTFLMSLISSSFCLIMTLRRSFSPSTSAALAWKKNKESHTKTPKGSNPCRSLLFL